jgi:hypothetical protein
MTEEKIDEEDIAFAPQWRDAMKRQVHNIIVSTPEASETMLEEVDPDSDPEELRLELMAAAINAVAAMGGGTRWRNRQVERLRPALTWPDAALRWRSRACPS